MAKRQTHSTIKKEVTNKITKNTKQPTITKKSTIKEDSICNRKIFIEYLGKQISGDVILEKFKLEWMKEHKLSDIKDLKIYYKTEEDTCYFVVNDDETLSIKMC